ncbi:MAG: diaminopimelate decarboxylase [Fibrobacteria bacterium]|nr:diaminopimelate decarboxylase [Fibrobacteria bacterium]
MNNLQNKIGNHRVDELAKCYQTPTFFYETETIKERIKDVARADVIRYAQKACSNIAILKLVQQQGVKVDAVSAGEIFRAVTAGFQTGDGKSDIVYTADIFDDDAISLIKKYQIPVNVGSPDMLGQLGTFAPGSKVTLRINPGFGHGHSEKVNTGGDLSKHGIWYKDIEECLSLAKNAGLTVHGLHMHIGSGSDFKHLSKVCEAMVTHAKKVGPSLEVISAGGGLPIPYQKDKPRIDLNAYFDLWDKTKADIAAAIKHDVQLEIEPGRYLVAESCTLLTQICSIKRMEENLFYLVNAGFDTLIRPAMYGAYHEISISPANTSECKEMQDVIVGGPLCESCDVFTQQEGGFVSNRLLPKAQVGDYLLIHDAGAYGAAMSSNYNSKRLAAEVLLTCDSHHLIRKRQTMEDLIKNEQIPDFLK